MKALVVGSAHLDILARPYHESAHKDRIGQVSIEVGGTACNAAFCLKRVGAEVRLLTAWSDASTSKLMATHIVATGIELIADEVSGMPLAAFVAQMTAGGDLMSAVSATPVDTHDFERSRIEQAMDGVDCVVVDANLRASAIREIALIAKSSNIRVYALAVSEDKVDRLIPSARLLAGAFMNHAECERLMTALQVADPSEVAEMFAAPLFVTRGERGSVVYQPDGSKLRILPAQLEDVTNVLGVGDAFSSGVIFGVVEKQMTFTDAADFAHGIVAEIAKQGACNPYSVNALNRMVGALWETSRMDTLTALFRRGAFELEFNRLQRGLNTIILIDCDNFKRVNDTLGHDVGDRVLKRLAEIIRTSIRAIDVPCRWGGDEFVVLLPRTDRIDAKVVAERMKDAVARENMHGVTLSLGITPVAPGEDLAAAVTRADSAMYDAKRSGKNAICFA